MTGESVTSGISPFVTQLSAAIPVPINYDSDLGSPLVKSTVELLLCGSIWNQPHPNNQISRCNFKKKGFVLSETIFF